METQKLVVAGAKSNIDWTGRKVTGAHNGTIGIQSGYLLFEADKLIGGHFVIDVSSLEILDITDPDTNRQFAGHLHSDDFFATEQFPEAVLVLKQVNAKGGRNYHVHGDLTIKGITAPVAFDAVVAKNGNTATATAKIVIDRTVYGIKFRSGNFFLNLGDTLIYNDFDLDIAITAEATANA